MSNIYLQLAILSLAVTRITWIITRDSIFEPIRNLVWKRSGPDDGVLGGIVDCPDCCGVWVALAFSLAWFMCPLITAQVSVIFALSIIPMIFARKVL